ncbi:unnamed protein product [Caenorhabditis nigoni]
MVKAPECRPKVSQEEEAKEPEDAPPPQQAPPHPSTPEAQYLRRWMINPDEPRRDAAQAPPPPAAPEPDFFDEIFNLLRTTEQMRREAQAPPILTREQQREVDQVLYMHRVFTRTPGRQPPMWDAQAPPPPAAAQDPPQQALPPLTPEQEQEAEEALIRQMHWVISGDAQRGVPSPHPPLRPPGEGNFVIQNGRTYTWAEWENRLNARGGQQ